MEFLLEEYTEAASIKDEDKGRLPLHHALGAVAPRAKEEEQVQVSSFLHILRPTVLSSFRMTDNSGNLIDQR